MELYHGSRQPIALHVGLCLTDDEESAAVYSDRRHVATLSVDLDGLRVVEVDGYDRETNTAPGDDGDNHGADVLVYDDEDEQGQAHRTWRLMSAAALERVAVTGRTHVAFAALIEHLRSDYATPEDALEEGEYELEDAIEALGAETVSALWRA